MKKRLLIILGLSANLFLIGCADDQARAQIADTNAKLSQLQSNVGVLDNKVSNQKLIDILNKQDSLQNQIDNLNGNYSTISSDQKNYQQTQEQLIKSLQDQIQDLQQQLATSKANASNVVTSSPKANSSQVSTTNDDQQNSINNLKIALRKIKKHDFPAAINELKTIIQTSQDENVVKSANYYLIISYAANGQYKDAIGLGRKFVSSYPQDKNAADALRTVYIAQKQLGYKISARKTANMLIHDYPDSDAVNKVKAEINSQRN
jgi:TolA-binding protein